MNMLEFKTPGGEKLSINPRHVVYLTPEPSDPGKFTILFLTTTDVIVASPFSEVQEGISAQLRGG